MSTWMERVAATPVTLKHMAKASAIAGKAPSDADMAYMLAMLLRAFGDKDLASAVMMRVNALSELLMSDTDLSPWVIKTDDRSYSIHEAIYHAAAVAPLSAKGFDLLELKRLAFEFADAQGEA